MKIAVCVKQVPTREWQPRVDDTRRGVRQQDASYEMNEPDAYALEEALRLREKHGGEVVVCTAGPSRAAQVLREALARGADRAIHVEDDRLGSINTDPFVVAGSLADAMRDEAFDLLLTGLQSDDQGAAQTGVILAERLALPHATIVMEVQVSDAAAGPGRGTLRVKRELEGGWFQWVAVPLPAVLTIQSGINQLRYATLKGIMAAKKKDIRKVTPASLPAAHVSIVSLDIPRKSKQTQLISGTSNEAARQLVAKLKDEARVLA
jgi:electron transfer flavoprotein beta subunit